MTKTKKQSNDKMITVEWDWNFLFKICWSNLPPAILPLTFLQSKPIQQKKNKSNFQTKSIIGEISSSISIRKPRSWKTPIFQIANWKGTWKKREKFTCRKRGKVFRGREGGAHGGEREKRCEEEVCKNGNGFGFLIILGFDVNNKKCK